MKATVEDLPLPTFTSGTFALLYASGTLAILIEMASGWPGPLCLVFGGLVYMNLQFSWQFASKEVGSGATSMRILRCSMWSLPLALALAVDTQLNPQFPSLLTISASVLSALSWLRVVLFRQAIRDGAMAADLNDSSIQRVAWRERHKRALKFVAVVVPVFLFIAGALLRVWLRSTTAGDFALYFSFPLILAMGESIVRMRLKLALVFLTAMLAGIGILVLGRHQHAKTTNNHTLSPIWAATNPEKTPWVLKC